MLQPKQIICCKVSIKYLRWCKIFPENGMENSFKYLSIITFLLGTIYSLLFFVLCYIINGARANFKIEQLKFGIVCAVSLCGIIWIVSFCVKNRHLLLSLLEALNDLETFGKPNSYEKFTSNMNFWSKIHAAYLGSGILIYFCIFAPMHRQSCIELNSTTQNNSEICNLILPIYIPFVGYQILLEKGLIVIYLIDFIEFSIIAISYILCATILWLNVEIVEYICLRIQHFKETMLAALKERNKIHIRQALNYHNEIMRMGSLADRFFGTELFLHVVFTGAILGVSAFFIIDTGNTETVLIFVGWLNAIIMGCSASQRLTNESLTIPDLLHKVDWYNFDNHLKKDIAFFLLRSQKPMHIKAGNVLMTNALIIQILKTAYSYVTFLSSINKH